MGPKRGHDFRREPGVVDPKDSRASVLPLADANQATYDAEGSVIFTRFGLHVTNDNVHDYLGGAMSQVWR